MCSKWEAFLVTSGTPSTRALAAINRSMVEMAYPRR
jgi:hypothetical protein